MEERGRKMVFENFSLYVDEVLDRIIWSDKRGPCDTCEFNFGGICANEYYGESVEKFNGKIMDCWSLGPSEYSRRWDEITKENDYEKIKQEAYEVYLKSNKKVALEYVLNHLKLSFLVSSKTQKNA
jgi:hypothetical protein